MTTRLSAALNRLSSEIDPGKYEERRYAREEGAVLKRSADVARDGLSDDGFSVISFDLLGLEGTGFVVRHDDSDQILGNLRLKVDREQLRLWFEAKGNFVDSNAGQPSVIPLEGIRDGRILDAIADQIGRLQFTGHPS